MRLIINCTAVVSTIARANHLVLRRRVVVSKTENAKVVKRAARNPEIRIAVKQLPVKKTVVVALIASRKKRAAAPVNQKKSARENVNIVAD
jgi:hypothetical protein